MTGAAGSEFVERFAGVRERIVAACAAVDRDPADVVLLAVSKTWPAATVVRAHEQTGHCSFGENRIQELHEKAAALQSLGIEWHMIGSVQTNKVKTLLDCPGLELLHSLDRIKLARALQAELEHRDATLRCLLQINATGEGQKHGVDPADAAELLGAIAVECPRLEVDGLMAMGPLDGAPESVLAQVATLRETLQGALGNALPILSLGMSGDLDAAVAAGSTLVRIGTALFGRRASPSR